MEIDGIDIDLCSDCESEEAVQPCPHCSGTNLCMDCLGKNHRHPEEGWI